MITEKEYLDAVRLEIKQLKQTATPEELAKLDFDRLDPVEHQRCIYGLMTGDCWSKRAKELIHSSCAPIRTDGFDSVADFAPGLPRNENDDYLSALEYHIDKHRSQNIQILMYLKGELDELPELTLSA